MKGKACTEISITLFIKNIYPNITAKDKSTFTNNKYNVSYEIFAGNFIFTHNTC